MPPKATVIISVYNRLDFLKLILAGFEMQTEKDFEIIISDDGSGEEFVRAVNELIKESPLNIIHNWHEDIGFRKNKLLNSSVILSSSAYLIFVDGDCIPHPRFVEEHLKNKKDHVCLAGRRADLSDRITGQLTAEKIKKGYLQSSKVTFDILFNYSTGKAGHIASAFYLKNKSLRRWFNRKERGLLGANFSIHKADLLAINGFDERYNKPTFGEDSDVELRLRLNGVQFNSVIGMANVYHCYHKLLPRLEESRLLYLQAVKENRPYTPYGIFKEEKGS